MTWLEFILGGYNEDFADNQQVFRVATIFLNRGINVNQLSGYGITPLHAAIVQNKPDIVKFLLKYGANPAVKSHIKEKIWTVCHNTA